MSRCRAVPRRPRPETAASTPFPLSSPQRCVPTVSLLLTDYQQAAGRSELTYGEERRTTTPAKPIDCEQRSLAATDGRPLMWWGIGIGALIWIVLFIWLGLRTLRNGHGWMFFLGIFFPLLSIRARSCSPRTARRTDPFRPFEQPDPAGHRGSYGGSCGPLTTRSRPASYLPRVRPTRPEARHRQPRASPLRGAGASRSPRRRGTRRTQTAPIR